MADTVLMPKLGFDMAEGTLVRWVLQEGDKATKGAVLAEIETDKATVEVETSFDGIVARHLVPAGAVVPVNTPIAVIAAPGEQVTVEATEKAAPPSPAAVAQKPAPAAVQPETAPSVVKASPLARKIASERGIALSDLSGSGPGGRIVKKDVEGWKPPVQSPAAGSQPSYAASLPAQAAVPSRLRAAIGRRMTEAKQQIPHFYVTHEYDMAALMALRKQVNSLLADDEKVSVNDFIVKAVALALRKFSNLNASLQNGTILQHGQVNIGVAVAVESGLLTIVCRDADTKPLRQIAAEVRSMAARARDGKVRPEEIEGSTFSVSNLGMFDVEHFIAIINPPEAGILAVGSVREIPVVQNGALGVGSRMKATISVDHRVSDGAEAARFMQELGVYLGEPLRLLL